MLRAIAPIVLFWLTASCPAAAQSHAPRVEDLFALHELGASRPYLALSPDGERIAFIERSMDVVADRYQHALIVVELETSAFRRIAEAGDIILASAGGLRSGAPLDRRPVWSPDGAYLYYIAEVEGRAELWRARADGGGGAVQVQTAGDVRRFVATPEAIIFETATPREDLAAERERAQRLGFRADDAFKPLASMLPPPREDAGAAVWRLSFLDGTMSRASGGERARLASPARPRLIRPIDPSLQAVRPPLSIFASASDDAARCMDSACSGRLEEAWTLDRAIVFLRREGHGLSDTAIYRWLPANGAVRRIRMASDRLAGCVASNEAIYCVQDSAAQPGRVVRIDAETGALRVVYDPNPQWRHVRLPRIERLEYTDAEGNESFAQLVYPAGYRRGRRYPLVIVQYRAIGFLNAGTGREAPIFPLAAQGYFVLSVDRPEFRNRESRLPARQLEREIELDGSESRAKREANLAFIAELDARGLVDRNRIAITGMSDGAQTLFDMLANAPAFAAAVAGSPPNDPILWPLQSPEFRASRAEEAGLAAPWDETSEWHHWWADNTPATHAQEMHTPLLLNLPEAEALRAFPLLTRMESTTTPVEAWIYPGAYHLKWRPAQIEASQRRSMDWINFWLRGIAPESEEDPRRAERWRALRDRQQAASP
jgi:dipeptidyl aminopeptidase/acylaminoacyl peptidase